MLFNCARELFRGLGRAFKMWYSFEINRDVLFQVEAALTTEPDNEELLKLKTDLEVCMRQNSSSFLVINCMSFSQVIFLMHLLGILKLFYVFLLV